MKKLNFSQYIGIPFKANGGNLDGINCWHLMEMVYREQFKINIPKYDLSEAPTAMELAALLKENEYPVWKKIEHVKIGDGILIRISDNVPLHVAVAVSSYEMLHIHKDINSCIERFDTGKWRYRILGFYRHVDMI